MFLTLNIWLIVIALVRVSSFKRGNTFDLVWTLFFQYLEPNIAILAASFSAFRSVFTKTGARHHPAPRPTYTHRQRLFKKPSSEERPLDDLPSVPGATLRSLRDVIRRNNRPRITASESNFTNLTFTSLPEDGNMNLEGHPHDHENATVVKRDWSMESTRVLTILPRKRPSTNTETTGCIEPPQSV